jgi:hypothetical protein
MTPKPTLAVMVNDYPVIIAARADISSKPADSDTAGTTDMSGSHCPAQILRFAVDQVRRKSADMTEHSVPTGVISSATRKDP